MWLTERADQRVTPAPQWSVANAREHGAAAKQQTNG
jgi:hypothetical protein